MRSLSEYCTLAESYPGWKALANRIPGGLYAPAAYGLESGGKRLRPVLLLMTAEALGADIENAIGPAAGIEMFHNFTLVHDDVMDRSDLRRGRPTVQAKWGEVTAILSGDAMLTLASQWISDVDDAALRPVTETFHGMALEVYEGQQYDMDFESRDDVSVDEYIQMITLKTGALIAGACEIGAIIAGASESDRAALRNFGYAMGIAFQIKDDYLDLYGDEATFGKPIGGDIYNNKKTFLRLAAIEKARGMDAKRLAATLAMEACPEKVTAARTLFSDLGVEEECQAAIASYTQAASDALDAINGINGEGKETLRSILYKLAGREK